MGGIFGGGNTVSNAETRLDTFRVNMSCYGGAIPIIFNKTRISGNLIDYVDFTAIPHTTKQTSGKGGKTTVENTTYTYTVAIAVAIGEGDINIGRIWIEKEIKDLGATGMQKYYNQVWPYIIGKYDDRAITYKNITYCAGISDLGSRDSLPQLSFEVIGAEYTPADMIVNLITNAMYGVGLSSQFIGDLNNFREYCKALNIKLAAGITDIQEAQSILSEIVVCTNSEFIWSNGKLVIHPYAENVISGNGVIYDPEIKITYNLTDDDFISMDDEDPVKIMRSIAADAYNCVKVEFINSANEYNTDIAEAKDTADIELNGLREADCISLHYIHDRDTATAIAYMMLHKNLYVRNRCRFKLGISYCLLEVFDIVSITDKALGYDNRPMRILEITENEDGTSEYEAEECLLGVDYDITPIGNPNENIYTDTTEVGAVNPPIILTAPTELTNNKLEIWLAISGKSKDWGGCQIWTSWDNAAYSYVNSKYGPSISGRLAEKINKDATVLTVDISESRSILHSVSAIDATNLVSLCYLDGEFFTYEIAELLATGKYTLKKLRRGLLGSTAVDHETGAEFAKLDSNIKKIEINQTLISQTAYLKLPSFDTRGDNLQYLDTAKAYPYYITLPNLPTVQTMHLTEQSGAVLVEFAVTNNSGYMYSEIYYRSTNDAEGSYIYGGMDKQSVTIKGLEKGKYYMIKVVPVITNNIKGAIETAKGQIIHVSGTAEGGGIYLNGKDAYILIPKEVIGGKQIFTIEMKVATTEQRNNSSYWNAPCLCGNSVSGSNNGDINIGLKNGKLIGSIALGYYGNPNIVTDDFISDGTVQRISLVSDGTMAVMYKDNKAYSITCGINRGLAEENLYFGYSLPLGGGRAEMILYEARFWDVARSPEDLGKEITQTETGLRAWYRCQEVAGTVLKDSSPNGRDGTLKGNVWG